MGAYVSLGSRCFACYDILTAIFYKGCSFVCLFSISSSEGVLLLFTTVVETLRPRQVLEELLVLGSRGRVCSARESTAIGR